MVMAPRENRVLELGWLPLTVWGLRVLEISEVSSLALRAELQVPVPDPANQGTSIKAQVAAGLERTVGSGSRSS